MFSQKSARWWISFALRVKYLVVFLTVTYALSSYVTEAIFIFSPFIVVKINYYNVVLLI